MIGSKYKKELFHHPLFIDALFVPTEQLHVKLVHRSPSKYQIQEPIVIPCQNEEISINQIQNILQTNFPKAHISQIVLPQSPQKSKIKSTNIQRATVRELKLKTGKRKETNIQLQFETEAASFSKIYQEGAKQSENRQKYEICLINLSTKSDVFQVLLQWTESVDVQKVLVTRINQWYQCGLAVPDVQFYRLKIELVDNKGFTSFRLKKQRPLLKQQLNEVVFSHQTQAIYIGFDIITTAFKYRRPMRSLMTQQNTINLEVARSRMGNNPIKTIAQQMIQPMQRILVVQYEDGTRIRLQYNELKQYKIKYLLGILRVHDYDRRGLVVFDKLYLPDQHVADFQFQYSTGQDMNFVMAKVTSQKKLFMEIIQAEQFIKQGVELTKLFSYCPQNKNNNFVCLNNYLNQAIYAEDNNQKGSYLCQIISNYIQKYFVEVQCLETTVWKKYIKSMAQQLNQCPMSRNLVYRVVDYECSAQIGDKIEFKNFIVTSKSPQKASYKLQFKPKFNKTFFTIKSRRGRNVGAVTTDFQLDEVMFLPYTSFKVTDKRKKGSMLYIQMQEICQAQEIHRSNLLLWVDDKLDEGQKIFQRLKYFEMKYPIILIQLNSNIEFKQALIKYQRFIENKNVRKIVITNMTRPENLEKDQVNKTAGIDTLTLSRQNIKDPKTKTIFYVGYLKAAEEKLRQNKIQPNSCEISVDGKGLLAKLIAYCNWQDVNSIQTQQMNEKVYESKFEAKSPESFKLGLGYEQAELKIESKIKGSGPKLPSIIQNIEADQPSPVKEKGWGNMFSQLMP